MNRQQIAINFTRQIFDWLDPITSLISDLLLPLMNFALQAYIPHLSWKASSTSYLVQGTVVVSENKSSHGMSVTERRWLIALCSCFWLLPGTWHCLFFLFLFPSIKNQVIEDKISLRKILYSIEENLPLFYWGKSSLLIPINWRGSFFDKTFLLFQ